ncbi:hypothetical protein CASFOL_020686 [Castilleja foliolosa]|uniref:Uncharacterized protein n=1 Tax=Castilleja foliolosa TaxID=1961234 RepID=A0ABD3D4C3_9LAMI
MRSDLESQVVIDQANNVAGMSFWKNMGYYVFFFLSHLSLLMCQVILILELVKKKQRIKSILTMISFILIEFMFIAIFYKLNQSVADYGLQREPSTRIRKFITGLRIFYVLLIVTAIGCVICMASQIYFRHLKLIG